MEPGKFTVGTTQAELAESVFRVTWSPLNTLAMGLRVWKPPTTAVQTDFQPNIPKPNNTGLQGGVNKHNWTIILSKKK